MISFYLILFASLALALDVNMVTLLVALIGGCVAVFSGPATTIIMFVLNERKAAAIRDEERAERIELARVTHAELAEVNMRGAEREGRIIDHVQAVKAETVAAREETKVALGVANDTNSKIASLGIQIAASPKEVIVVNDANYRVPTENKSVA